MVKGSLDATALYKPRHTDTTPLGQVPDTYIFFGNTEIVDEVYWNLSCGGFVLEV